MSIVAKFRGTASVSAGASLVLPRLDPLFRTVQETYLHALLPTPGINNHEWILAARVHTPIIVVIIFRTDEY